jgi:hypothetical protein
MSTKGTDIAAIIGKGLVGAIPFVGPLAAEIVGAIIPNQRIDRIETVLRLLETKISEEDKEKVKQRIVSPESVDLIEDGFVQASRALSEERKEYIASLLKNSLTDDQLKHIEYKRLLSILGELNDLEVLILKSLTFLHGEEGSNEFWEKHEKALDEPIAYLGSPQEEWDKFEIYKTHKEHLVRLGLLKIRFNKPNKGEVPEFDEHTGMIKAQGYDITSLGELFLRSIG